MSNVWFTSDLHLGHENIAKLRGFASAEDHDECLIDLHNNLVGKKDKVFILGDFLWNRHKATLAHAKRMAGTKELIFGNHDTFAIKSYQEVGVIRFHGFRRYKKFWISHAPIHPYEIRGRGNIHGHIHPLVGDCPPLGEEYFNVNVEAHAFCPTNLDEIERHFWGFYGKKDASV